MDSETSLGNGYSNAMERWCFVSATVMEVDSNAAIEMAKQGQGSIRTKHIDMKFHHVRDLVQNGVVTLKKVGTEKQMADILTSLLVWM